MAIATLLYNIKIEDHAKGILYIKKIHKITIFDYIM